MTLPIHSYIGAVSPPYVDPRTGRTVPTPVWQGSVQAVQWYSSGDMAALGVDLDSTVIDGPTVSAEFPEGSVVITRSGTKYLCENGSWPTICSDDSFVVWTSEQFSSMYGA